MVYFEHEPVSILILNLKIVCLYLLQCFFDFCSTSIRVFSEDLLARHWRSQSKAGENKVRYLGISTFCTARIFCTVSFWTCSQHNNILVRIEWYMYLIIIVYKSSKRLLRITRKKRALLWSDRLIYNQF